MLTRALSVGPKPQTLPADTPVRVVLRLMFEQHINHVALLDTAGRCLGLAGVGVALGLVIPASAQARQGLHDLAFVGDALPMLLDHFREILDRPATTLLDPHAISLRANTPLMEAALLLARAPTPLPVLDDQGMLVGILSQRALLQFLATQAGAD